MTEPAKPFTVTVSQVNRRLSLMVKGDKSLADIYVKGELSNFTHHYKSGHMYFTLKDGESALKCVMFRSQAQLLRFQPEDGLQVLVRGGIQVFERDGVFQLYAVEMEPEGLGGLYLAFEQLKARLEAEGLFSQKRRLPAMPARLCIITSKTGAALQDMLNILERRFLLLEVVLISATVQGKDAPMSLVKALTAAQSTGAQVIILGRGGGSAEDLWAFNDEAVARAVYASPIPTISAVGHETDFTITDFVADLRAPTPSAAAELAVPDISGIYAALSEYEQALTLLIRRKIAGLNERLHAVSQQISASSPRQRLKAEENRLGLLEAQITSKIKSIYHKKETELMKAAEVIDALSPVRVLMRGYSITSREDGRALRSTEGLAPGELVQVRLHAGGFTARIEEIMENGE